MGREVIYIASPYSHTDPWVREERYKQTLDYVAKCALKNECVFSPIVHTHDLGKKLKMPHDFWMALDLPVLRRCDKVRVLCLEGWQYSKGVAEEIKEAQAYGIPVEHINPELV